MSDQCFRAVAAAPGEDADQHREYQPDCGQLLGKFRNRMLREDEEVDWSSFHTQAIYSDKTFSRRRASFSSFRSACTMQAC